VLKELNHLGLLCPALKLQHAEVICFYGFIAAVEPYLKKAVHFLKRNGRYIVVNVTVSTKHKIK
jgi:hypothetical protein